MKLVKQNMVYYYQILNKLNLEQNMDRHSPSNLNSFDFVTSKPISSINFLYLHLNFHQISINFFKTIAKFLFDNSPENFETSSFKTLY